MENETEEKVIGWDGGKKGAKKKVQRMIGSGFLTMIYFLLFMYRYSFISWRLVFFQYFIDKHHQSSSGHTSMGLF